jgi:hypothetical protein
MNQTRTPEFAADSLILYLSFLSFGVVNGLVWTTVARAGRDRGRAYPLRNPGNLY